MASRIAKFIDIGGNLTDPVFRGVYRGKRKHQDDFLDMARRAADFGLSHILVTGGSLNESKQAVALCKEFLETSPVLLSATVGCHPTRSSELVSGQEVKTDYIDGLVNLILNNSQHVAAIGEFGLDYDRLHFADKETQLIGFERQFELVVQKFGQGFENIKPLPLFLHCRAAETDFYNIVKKYRASFINGVVHSFTGTIDECSALLDLDLYIGINGCSMKTEENLDVVRQLPLNRIMLETDCPYCEIRPSHASHKLLPAKNKESVPKLCHPEKWQPGCIVRGRNEPSKITDVFEVLVALRCEKDGLSKNDLADVILKNTLRVFSNLSSE